MLQPLIFSLPQLKPLAARLMTLLHLASGYVQAAKPKVLKTYDGAADAKDAEAQSAVNALVNNMANV